LALDLVDYEVQARRAVAEFWRGRSVAAREQAKRGVRDQGERAAVTAGKNLDGFGDLITRLVRANGLTRAEVHRKRALLTLPGYYRATKIWDLVVMDGGQLVAALELKSHVGPSFGNNFNNRAEEAIGMGHDFWTAFRAGGIGANLPFAGWMMLVEDTRRSRSPVKDAEPHFSVFPEFKGASYQMRYELLCRRMVQEKLYTAAAVIASSRSAEGSGEYRELSEATGLRTFLAMLAGHVAACAARPGR